MATTDREGFVLNGLNLNDGVGWDIENFTFTPAAKKPQFVGNNDADGEALVREANYTNSYFDLQVRPATKAPSTTVALEKVGDLLDAIQGCERTEGGAEALWTPNGTEKTFTAYALLAELTELPIEVTGDLAGWLVQMPVIKFKLTCRPLLYQPERVVLAAKESGAEPMQVVYVKCGGDVSAEARLIFKDEAAQDRRFVQWGRDVVPSETNPALLITAANLTTTEFSGTAVTLEGAYASEKVKSATPVSAATTICGTGRIAHVGPFAVYLRLRAETTESWFRISYRNGDGPLIPLKWKQPSVAAPLYADVFMGEVALDEVPLGSQTSEIRIEHKTAGATIANAFNYINYLLLIPTAGGSGRARGLSSLEPTKLLALDQFNQSAGNLEGKSPDLGSAWTAVGKTGANGFVVNETLHVAERAKVSDPSLKETAFAFPGSAEYETIRVGTTFSCSVPLSLVGSGYPIGVVARWTSTENYLLAGFRQQVGEAGSGVYVVIWLITPTGSPTLATGFLGGGILTNQRIELQVDTTGRCWAWAFPGGSTPGKPIAEGFDYRLATGGATVKGRAGIHDGWNTAIAAARTYDDFQIVTADTPARACYSGRQIEFRSDGPLRQDSTGVYDGPPSIYRGADFYLSPEGDSGLINRIALRGRRSDVEEEADSAVTDKHKAEIRVVERFLAPR